MADTNVKVEEGQDEIMKEKLVAQIEYYFGDVNLPRDKFIKEECSKNEGWFPVPTLLKFNRVANILKGVKKDDQLKTICDALKPSELIDVKEEDLIIRRNPECPLPEKDSEERTVYLKGFPRMETTLDDLLEFFKKYGTVESVIMRYYKEKTIKTEAEIKKEKEEKLGISSENGNEKDEETGEPQLVWVRKFKGSIFVVFKKIEEGQKVLDDADLIFGGAHIQNKMWQADYKMLKNKEYQEKVAGRKRNNKTDVKKEVKAEDVKEEVPKDALIKILNVPDGHTREVIKEKWYSVLDQEKFNIAFVDFNRGDKNAVFRLEREGAASEALEAIPDKKLKMIDEADGKEAVYSEVAGFEEEEQAKYIEEIKRQREVNRNKKRPAYGGRGGGRGGKRRRRF